MWCFVSLFLVVSTSAIECLKRLVSEMTYYVSSATLHPTHLLRKAFEEEVRGKNVCIWCVVETTRA